MEKYCQNTFCETEAVEEVPVSVKKPSDEVRALCATCAEAYTWGVQHGRMTSDGSAARVREAVEEVLESLDAGGEQSRQFADEIKTLRQALGS